MEKEVLKENHSVSFVYNPVTDIAPVDQYGFIDLRDAFVNHCIPGDLSVVTEDFNGVEDPDSLIGSPHDVFEAFRKAQYVKSRSAGKAPEPQGEGASSTASE